MGSASGCGPSIDRQFARAHYRTEFVQKPAAGWAAVHLSRSDLRRRRLVAEITFYDAMGRMCGAYRGVRTLEILEQAIAFGPGSVWAFHRFVAYLREVGSIASNTRRLTPSA